MPVTSRKRTTQVAMHVERLATAPDINLPAELVLEILSFVSVVICSATSNVGSARLTSDSFTNYRLRR